MQVLVDNFSKSGEQVDDLFSGTLAIANACLELQRHRRFLGCKHDSECFAAITQALVEMYATRVLNEKSEYFCTDELMDAWKTVVQALFGLQARMRMRS